VRLRSAAAFSSQLLQLLNVNDMTITPTKLVNTGSYLHAISHVCLDRVSPGIRPKERVQEKVYTSNYNQDCKSDKEI